jgi:hypothetical protein
MLHRSARGSKKEGDGTLIGAEAATEKEVTQRHAQLVAMLVPVAERFAFGMRSIATGETNGSYLQLPMCTSLPCCSRQDGSRLPNHPESAGHGRALPPSRRWEEKFYLDS